MTTYALPDGRTIAPGRAFSLAGVSYPARWLELSTPEELAEREITLVPAVTPPPAPAPTSADLLRILADWRWIEENAGVSWGALKLPTDRERRSALKDAADKMRDGTLTSPIAVAFSAEVYASVTLEQLDAAVGIITTHVQKVFSDAMGVAAQIAAGTITTQEQLTAAWRDARRPPQA